MGGPGRRMPLFFCPPSNASPLTGDLFAAWLVGRGLYPDLPRTVVGKEPHPQYAGERQRGRTKGKKRDVLRYPGSSYCSTLRVQCFDE